jgi:hypothetical protein
VPGLCDEADIGFASSFPVRDWRRMPLGRAVVIGGVTFKVYPVQHSVRAPAVGYRVSAEGNSFFYLPDVAWLPNASHALRGIGVYIGDGAAITHPMIWPRGKALIGHATMAAQLHWCQRAHVREAVFTHCGSQVVDGDARRLNAVLRHLGHQRDIDARLACDGYRLVFTGDGAPQLVRPTGQHT